MAGRLGELRATASAFRTDLWGDGRGWVLVFVALGWFLVLGGRIVYPALLPLVAGEFGISYATVGVLVGVLWTSYALLQFPGGVLADRVGERTVLTGSLALSLVAMVTVVLSPTFVAFVAATVLLGVGNGLFGTTRITVLSDVFSDMDTTAISLCQAAGNVGNAVLPATAGVAAAALGWRMGFGYLVPLFAVAGVGLWQVVPARTSPSAGRDRSLRLTLRAVAAAVRTRPVLVVTAALCLAMFAYQGLTGFLPTYLVEVKGLGPGVAALLYGTLFATAIVVQFVSGVLSDRYGQRFALAASLLVGAPGFALLPFVDDVAGLLAAVMLLSATFGGFPPAHAYAVRAVPTDVQGSGYGLLRTLYIAFGAAGPPLVGTLADGGRFDEAFLVLGAVVVLAVVASAALPSLE